MFEIDFNVGCLQEPRIPARFENGRILRLIRECSSRLEHAQVVLLQIIAHLILDINF